MTLLSKVQPGTPIRADQWNALVDAILAARRITSDGTLQVSRGQTGTHLGIAPRAGGVPIKNDNSSQLPAFGVAYVKSIDTTTWPGLPVLVVDRLASTFQRDLVVNGPEPIAAGSFGLAQTGPLVTVAYDSGTPAVGDGYGPKASQWTATKNYPSVLTSLGVVDSSSKWMLARLEPPSFLIGQLEADCDKGSSGTVYLLESDDSTEDKITDWSVTAINLFGDIEAGTGSGTGVTKPAKVALNWINGKWYMVAADCDPGVA